MAGSNTVQGAPELGVVNICMMKKLNDEATLTNIDILYFDLSNSILRGAIATFVK
ncbi:MAG: hypothetical protein ABI863_15115 [Ginsengibacter sp.]